MRPLLVVGNAPCFEEDLQRLGALESFDLMAVNRTGISLLAPLAFWATYHPQTMVMERWREQRAERGGNPDYAVVSHAVCRWIKGLQVCAPAPSQTGSSVLLGVFHGMALGYSEIVVAGAPLSHPDYQTFHEGWEASRGRLAAHGGVRSLSGWTKDFLEEVNRGH